MRLQQAGLTRRDLARLTAAGSAALIMGAKLPDPITDYPFRLGVAAGDPLPNGFVIWSRLCTQPAERGGGMAPLRYPVRWEVAEDSAFRTIVAKGDVIAQPELGHSIHVELANLQPQRHYWYRFHVDQATSPTGRARTAQSEGVALERLRFAMAGCQHYEHGYYTAYHHLAAEDLDFVYHSGDYIYEMAANEVVKRPLGGLTPIIRCHTSNEIFSLDDYRLRFAQYRADPYLQAAHASAAWFVGWDDHEVSNNWAGEYDQLGTPAELFLLRRAAAFQAYYEFMPLRRSALPRGNAMQLHRRAQFGDLLQVHVLDTRQYRSNQPCGDKVRPQCEDIKDPATTIIGPDQERWLFDGLANKTPRWNLIAQQVMMMDMDRRTNPADQTVPLLNMDAWTGYRVARQRLLDHMHGLGLTNVVVATGDEHQNYAGEIRLQGSATQSPVVACEFVSTSISTGGDGSDLRPGAIEILARNPHCQLLNDQRGYVVCDVDRARWTTSFKVLDHVTRPGSPLTTRARFVIEAGIAGLQHA